MYLTRYQYVTECAYSRMLVFLLLVSSLIFYNAISLIDPKLLSGYLTPISRQIERGFLNFKRTNLETEQKLVTNSFQRVLQPDRIQLPTGLYVTAWPDHGAGVGHQFGEWLQGIWAAYKYNITYLYTPFLINSAHWNSFLGFDINEITEEDLRKHNKPVKIKQIGNSDQTHDTIEQWILQQRSEHLNQSNVHSVVLLRLYRINCLVAYEEAACYSPISNTLRTKYCVKRVLQPVETDLYNDDRLANRFIVSMHIRCGDSCYDFNRITSLDSVKNTILRLNTDLSFRYTQRKVVFHLFSEAPLNNTAENYFGSFLNSQEFQIGLSQPIIIVPHFSLTAPVTLHHLIMSDLLLTAKSSFSQLAASLRIGLTFGAVPGCQDKLSILDYNRKTGYYSSENLLKALQYNELFESKNYTTNKLKYKSVEECYIYQSYNDI